MRPEGAAALAGTVLIGLGVACIDWRAALVTVGAILFADAMVTAFGRTRR